MIDGELSEFARQELFVQSGGNPFYLQELARGSPSGAGVAAADVPRSVALALDQEVRALPDDAQRLARAAAVVGDPMVLDVAVAAAELEEARRCKRWMRCWAPRCWRRPRCRAATASAIRWSDGRSTTRRRTGGDSAHTPGRRGR